MALQMKCMAVTYTVGDRNLFSLIFSLITSSILHSAFEYTVALVLHSHQWIPLGLQQHCSLQRVASATLASSAWLATYTGAIH